MSKKELQQHRRIPTSAGIAFFASVAMAMDDVRSLRILIVDDNQDTLLTLGAWLKANGHVIRTLANGTRAIEAVSEFEPDVCILDIQMPGANGFVIGRELVETYGAARPFLIAISGKFFSTADRLVALKCGFDHFLEKPADPREISNILNEVARRNGPGAPS
ncbi:MAG: response regulator [Betaproteobacteria bacterium]|nr:MAG: response regulator [Betaproteobacteria bacterium]